MISDTGILWKVRQQPIAVRLWSNRMLHLLGSSDVPETDQTLDIRINDFGHIERFEQTVSWLSRQTFIEENRRRIAEGTLVFTLADDEGPLLAYGFAHRDTPQSVFPYVNQRVVWPPATGTIYGGFVHPSARGRGLHGSLQTARIAHLVGECGMKHVVSGVTGDNASAMASAQKAGLQPIADLCTRYRLGKPTKSVVRHRHDFNAGYPDALQ